MLIITNDGPKTVPSLKSHIGKDLDEVIKEMETTGKYQRFYSREGINGYRNVTMVRYGTYIEIVAEPMSESNWNVLDIFGYGIEKEIPRF